MNFSGAAQFPGNQGFVTDLPVHCRVEPLRSERISDVENDPEGTGQSRQPQCRVFRHRAECRHAEL